MEIIDTIKERESELQELYDRMDKDRDAVHLNKYTLTGFDQWKDKEIPRTVSVTMNEPGVFANGVVSVLQGMTRQIVVEGLTDEKNKLIENFFEDNMYTADNRLQKSMRISSLWDFVCDHITKRGPIGVRWTYDNDGSPRCVPIDMRYCPFQDGTEELEWAASKTWRSAADIRSEWGNEEGVDISKLPETGTNIVVRDHWGKRLNTIFIDDKKAIELPNPYGFVPHVIQFPPAGDYLMDQGYLKYWAESIFFLVRDLYPEWNRLMSIQQTKALEWVRPPYTHPVKDGEDEKQPYPHQIGTNTPYLEGQEPKLLETQDETRAFQDAQVSMSTAIHKGSANITDLADVAGLRNASWITEQTEIRDKILTPRTKGLQMFFPALYELMVREYQIRKFTNPIPLGRGGNRRQYKPSELGDLDSYTIEVRMMPDNKKQKLANYTIGLSLRGTLSEDTIIRDIYQCDDPDGELDKLRAEEARKTNPIIFYYDLSARLIDVAQTKEGEERKRLLRQARIMADSMVDAIKKSKMSGQSTGTQDLQLEKGSSQGLLALPALEGGGTQGGKNG